MNPFYEDVYRIVQQIPTGKVASYSQIAWALGKMNGARAVGRAMKSCPAALPAHRVVRADGEIVGFTAVERKQQLLAEGVIFKPNGKIDMKQCSWRQLFF
jgi:methylated-DNA-protein-cysteine methyltransferase-like protein